MSYENPEKRLSLIHNEVFDPNSEIYLENLLDLAASVTYDIHSSGTWKNSKPIKSFLERYSNFSDKVYKYRVSVNDFECLKTIGQGGFGRVDLVKHKQTKNIYAMKIIEKTTYIQNAFNGFWEERDILAKNVSDWLVKCFYSFMDLKKLYIVMEYMPGGNLYYWLMTLEEFNDEQTHFYAMEMILAVETLHEMQFLHRDLKPDNMLLDKNGHLKLADFGTCIRVNNGKVKTNFQVGTPDYIAPEVLRKAGVNDLEVGFEIDWWALGIVIFEMFYGETPFEGESTATLYKNIMCYKNTLCYPDDKLASNELLDFLKNILTEPGDRMNIKAIKSHPYIVSGGYSWNLDNIRQHQSPLIFEVSGDADTRYITFEPSDKRSNIASSFTNNNFFSGENLAFTGFTFNRSHQYGSSETVMKSTFVESSQKMLELQTQLSEIDLSKKQLEKKLEKVTSDFSLVQTKLSVVEKELIAKEQIINSKMQEQSQSVDLTKQLKSKIEVLTKQFETSQKEITHLKSAIAEKEGLIMNIKLDMSNTSETVTILEKNLQISEQKLQEVSIDLEEKVHRIDSLLKMEAFLEEERNTTKNLTSDISIKNRQIIECENQIEKLNNTILDLNSQYMQFKNSGINHNDNKDEFNCIKEQYDRLLREKQALESKINSLHADLKEMHAEQEHLRSELRLELLKKTASEKTRERLNKELIDHKSRFSLLQNKQYEAEDEIRNLKKKLNNLECEKGLLKEQCTSLLTSVELQRVQYEDIIEEHAEVKDDFEKKCLDLETQRQQLQAKYQFYLNEYEKVKLEFEDQNSKIESLMSDSMEKDRLVDFVATLKKDIDEKEHEIDRLSQKNHNYEIEIEHSTNQSMSDKLKIDALVVKINDLVKNPESVQKYLPRKKKDTANKESGKRIKQLEMELNKAKANLDEKMHELSDVKNECQVWRDKSRESDLELEKKDSVIKQLLNKMSDSIVKEPDLDEDATKKRVMSTFLEGRIEILKKGKGRHKVTWIPSFAVLQPFKLEIFQNKNDLTPQQTIDLHMVMHIKEATQADCLHVDKKYLSEMLQIIYDKPDSEQASRASKSSTLSTLASLDEAGSRASMQDLTMNGLQYVENHFFVPMRFRSPQICDLCHQSLSELISPPAALECSRCKKRIHEEHVSGGGHRIPACQGAIEVLSMRLESAEARIAWLQRLGQLKQYQKADEARIAPHTYYRSVRVPNNNNIHGRGSPPDRGSP